MAIETVAIETAAMDQVRQATPFGAAASHGTALWLWKLADEAPGVVDVVVPESRRVLRQPGLRVHRRRALNSSSALIRPSAQPARLRVEEAVLDHCDAVAAPAAIDLVLRATQRRVTTADRLRLIMQQRPRQRWRSLLLDVLAEVQVGVSSNLELAYRRDVEQRHRLPGGTRNEAENGRSGGHRYHDVRYRTWHVLVELDGREAHPAGEAFRDMRRDNVAAVAGHTALRYGWRDVVGDPCGVPPKSVPYWLLEVGPGVHEGAAWPARSIVRLDQADAAQGFPRRILLLHPANCSARRGEAMRGRCDAMRGRGEARRCGAEARRGEARRGEAIQV